MTFKTTFTVRKVEFLRVSGTKEPDTLWVGYRGLFSDPKLRSRLRLERCSFWPQNDTFVLLRHQFEDDSNTFRVTSGRERQLKIKLLRGCKKLSKLTIAVDDLLAMTSQGSVKLHFSFCHPLGHALIQLERTVARQEQDQIWFTPPTSSTEEEESDTYFSCTDLQEQRQKLPSHYNVRLPSRRRPETLPLAWRLRLEQEKSQQQQEQHEQQQDHNHKQQQNKQQQRQELPQLYTVRLPSRRRPETLPLAWRQQLHSSVKQQPQGEE